MYSIFFTSQARRLFKKLPQDVQEKLKAEAGTLSQNPLAGEPLQGSHRQTGLYIKAIKVQPTGLFIRFYRRQTPLL